MSTSYQIFVQDSSNVNFDIEEKNRFYKVRDISQEPQSAWLFIIFQQSMNARTLAIGLVTFIYTLVVIYFYGDVTSRLNTKLPLLLLRKNIFDEIDVLKALNNGVDNKVEIALLQSQANLHRAVIETTLVSTYEVLATI